MSSSSGNTDQEVNIVSQEEIDRITKRIRREKAPPSHLSRPEFQEYFSLYQRLGTTEFKRALDSIAQTKTERLVLRWLDYWFRPNKQGRSHLRVHRNGHWWVVRTAAEMRTEWKKIFTFSKIPHECTISRNVQELAERGLIVVEKHRWNRKGERRSYTPNFYRLLPEALIPRLGICLNLVDAEKTSRQAALNYQYPPIEDGSSVSKSHRQKEQFASPENSNSRSRKEQHHIPVDVSGEKTALTQENSAQSASEGSPSARPVSGCSSPSAVFGSPSARKHSERDTPPVSAQSIPEGSDVESHGARRSFSKRHSTLEPRVVKHSSRSRDSAEALLQEVKGASTALTKLVKDSSAKRKEVLRSIFHEDALVQKWAVDAKLSLEDYKRSCTKHFELEKTDRLFKPQWSLFRKRVRQAEDVLEERIESGQLGKLLGASSRELLESEEFQQCIPDLPWDHKGAVILLAAWEVFLPRARKNAAFCATREDFEFAFELIKKAGGVFPAFDVANEAWQHQLSEEDVEFDRRHNAGERRNVWFEMFWCKKHSGTPKSFAKHFGKIVEELELEEELYAGCDR